MLGMVYITRPNITSLYSAQASNVSYVFALRVAE
jgi:hypothetical protein